MAGSTSKSLSRIVLGSTSPRRLELLRSLGFGVEVAASGYDERADSAMSPAQLAETHARGKLEALLDRQSAARLDVPVVTADTVVDLDGAALGKPQDPREARRMLELLSGREHLVHTAFAMAVPHGAAWTQERGTTRVRFYPLAREEIEEYIASGEPFDKAGAYGIQGRAAALVESIDGDYFTVVGLPLARFVRALRRLGFTLPETK